MADLDDLGCLQLNLIVQVLTLPEFSPRPQRCLAVAILFRRLQIFHHCFLGNQKKTIWRVHRQMQWMINYDMPENLLEYLRLVNFFGAIFRDFENSNFW